MYPENMEKTVMFDNISDCKQLRPIEDEKVYAEIKEKIKMRYLNDSIF